jgi:hypothetical protein
MQDRFQPIRDRVAKLPGSRRKRAQMLGINDMTLMRFERGDSQTRKTIDKIEAGLKKIERDSLRAGACVRTDHLA